MSDLANLSVLRSPARLTAVTLGLSVSSIGVLGRDTWFAAMLSPDGVITEVMYLYLLRAAIGAVGVAIALGGAFASRTSVQNGALTVGGCAFALAVLEVGLRGAEWLNARSRPTGPIGLRASSIAELVYENTPNFSEDGERKFNSLGMRDEERVLDPSRDTIVVVGDSIEAWRELAIPDLYPRALERLLNEQRGSDPLQVVNLGVTGYSLHQKYLMLKQRGLAWKPRLAVVGYCLNDPIPAGELLVYFGEQPAPKVELKSLRLVNSLIRNVMNRFGIDFYTKIHRSDSDEWLALVDDMNRLGALGREHGFPIFLVIVPLMGDTAVEYPWLDIHRRVGKAARQAGLEVIDLLDPYRAGGFAAVRADDVHPNAVGHHIAARELFDRIRQSPTIGLLAAKNGSD